MSNQHPRYLTHLPLVLLRAIVVAAIGAVIFALGVVVAIPASAATSLAASDAGTDSTAAETPAPERTATPAVTPSAEPTATASPTPGASATPSSTVAPETTATPDPTNTPPATAPTPPPTAASSPEVADDAAEAPVAPAPPVTTATKLVSAITDVAVNVDHATDGDTLQLQAEWTLPESTHDGDHFGLDLPTALVGVPVAPFPLLDAGGEVVGECVVHKADVVCTTSDYVDTHHDVHGGLWITVKAHVTSETHEVEIADAGGIHYMVPVVLAPEQHTTSPSHSPRTYTPGTEVTKRAMSVNGDRHRVRWEVRLPAGDGAVVVNDSWTATGAAADDISLVGNPTVRCKAAGSGAVTAVPGRNWSVTESSGGFSLDLAGSCNGTYIVQYWTQLPASADHVDVTNTADVPGIGTAHAHKTWNAPATLRKTVRGNNADRSATWTVRTAADAAGSGTVVVRDTYSDRLTLREDSVSVRCEVLGRKTPVDASDWSIAGSDAARHVLQVDISDQTCRVDGGVYAISYTTDYPRDAFSGESYQNSVAVASRTVTRSVTYTAVAGGAATSTPMWVLHLTKDVTGPGEKAVGDTDFTVQWSWDDGTRSDSGQVTVSDGTGATIARIPAGAQVTLKEADAAVAGVWFAQPAYTGDGVQQTGARSATVTGNSGTVSVGLENPTSLVPVPTPTATPLQVPVQVPSAGPVATPPLVPSYKVPVLAPRQVPQQVPNPTPVATPNLVPPLAAVVTTPATPQATTTTPATPQATTTTRVTSPTPATPASAQKTPPTHGQPVLAHTGTNPRPAILGAAALLAAGAGLVVADRRRRG